MRGLLVKCSLMKLDAIARRSRTTSPGRIEKKFYRRGCQEKHFSLDWMAGEEFALASSPYGSMSVRSGLVGLCKVLPVHSEIGAPRTGAGMRSEEAAHRRGRASQSSLL